MSISYNTDGSLRKLKVFMIGAFAVLLVACHPEGFYGPKSFGYNTTGVAISNLFGTYHLDSKSSPLLASKGFSDASGYIQLKDDLTCEFVKIPCIISLPKTGAYSSATVVNGE